MENDLKKLIQEKSGNNLHLENVDFLKKLDWSVDISPYYCDDFTDKPREIDIIATRKIQILEGAWEENKNFWFNVVLFIECKNFTNNLNFRIFNNDQKLSKEILCNQSLNLYLGAMIKETENQLKNHHYLITPMIAKLYDYPKKDKNGKDNVFDAMTQSLKSYIFFKDKKAEGVKGGIYYPMVIYDKIDGIYSMSKNNREDKYLDSLKKSKNNIFHLKYSYPKTDFISSRTKNLTEDFYIDFIHKDELGNFLTNIEKNEIEKIKLFLGDVKNR